MSTGAGRFRVGPFREGGFRSPLHDERLGAWLGLALGVSFTVCFATGLLSHAIQQPPSWFIWPSRPVNLYRVTQGFHVVTGIASIPLLLAKLWVVYPHFWSWPVVRDVAHAVERLSLVFLVGGGLFLLYTGVLNISYWYSPLPFFFPAAHYWAAWITIGALVVHIAAKTTAVGDALSGKPAPPLEGLEGRGGLSRRGFMGAVGATSGVLALAVVGQTIAPLRRLAVLAPRRPRVGPQALPVNKSAAEAGVEEDARDPGYRLMVEGKVETPLQLTLDELRALPQHDAGLPIACVEGWSAAGQWRGPRVRDLLDRAGAAEDADVRVESLQKGGRYRMATMNRLHARDADTLLALELNGEPLHLDHGYPARLIGPNRPGVQQTKWVSKLVVL